MPLSPHFTLCGNFLPKKYEKRKQRLEKAKVKKTTSSQSSPSESGVLGWGVLDVLAGYWNGKLGEMSQLAENRAETGCSLWEGWDSGSEPLMSCLWGVTYPRTTAFSVLVPWLPLSWWPDTGQVFQGPCSWFPRPPTNPFCMTRPVLLKPSSWSHNVSLVILTLTNTPRHIWEPVSFLKRLQSLKIQRKPASLLESPKDSASVCLFVFLR